MATSLATMYNQNSDHKGVAGAPPPPPNISPRISFSNDFVVGDHSHSHSNSHSHHQITRPPYRDAPVSSDFEFSVSNYSMMSADELFFKGRLLPLKESCTTSTGKTTTTLRDELQNQEDDNGDDFSLRPPKNPNRWRGFLGLRKSHIGSKKAEKPPLEKRNQDDVQCSKNSQDFVD